VLAKHPLYRLTNPPYLVADQRIELRPIGYEPIVLPLHSSALFEVLRLQLRRLDSNQHTFRRLINSQVRLPFRHDALSFFSILWNKCRNPSTKRGYQIWFRVFITSNFNKFSKSNRTIQIIPFC
jgi:hypothetical protein